MNYSGTVAMHVANDIPAINCTIYKINYDRLSDNVEDVGWAVLR